MLICVVQAVGVDAQRIRRLQKLEEGCTRRKQDLRRPLDNKDCLCSQPRLHAKQLELVHVCPLSTSNSSNALLFLLPKA